MIFVFASTSADVAAVDLGVILWYIVVLYLLLLFIRICWS